MVVSDWFFTNREFAGKIISEMNYNVCVWWLALDDRQETSLIEIMVCSVKQAATGEYPVGRGPTSRRPTTKEARQVSDDKGKLTEHFIVTLPQLLAKVNTLQLLSDLVYSTIFQGS